MQPAVGQGTLNDAVGTHPPIPLAAARSHVDLLTRNPQGEEMASPRARLFPLLPVVEPHSSPDPFGQFHDLIVGVADAEVVEPAGDVAAQFVDDVPHAVPPIASGHFPHPLLEPCVGLGRPHRPPACADLEAQKSALLERRGLAFDPADYQPEPSFHEPCQGGHHPFGRLRALHHDEEIIGVTSKAMPAAFEFLVEWVERDCARPAPVLLSRPPRLSSARRIHGMTVGPEENAPNECE